MAKSVNYPKKETINLAMKEKPSISLVKLIPGIIIIVLAAGIFSKFAVIDLMARLYDLQRESQDLANQITIYQQGIVDYEETLAEYTQRSNKWMTEEELLLIDYKTFFPLIEKTVLPYSDINSVSLQGNDLALNLINLSLQDASNIIKELTAREDVVSVSINTANRKSAALTNQKTGEAMLIVELTNGYELPKAETVPAPGVPAAN